MSGVAVAGVVNDLANSAKFSGPFKGRWISKSFETDGIMNLSGATQPLRI